MIETSLRIDNVEEIILDLLYMLREEDPQNISRNMYAKNLVCDEITDKMVHDAIFNLYHRGAIVFEHFTLAPKPGYPHPLSESTFHLPN